MPDYAALNPRNVVGLDLSLSTTGFHRLGTYASGAISAQHLAGMERLDYILAQIAGLVQEGDFVVVEDHAFHAVGNARSKLAELSGIVKFWMWRRQVPYVLVAPTALKKFILGSGRGEKALILREVYKAYGLDAGTDDEADACVLAHIGACLLGREEPRNKAQREVLDALNAAKTAPK
jgi:Holliday junction resolvasome RuvABC endonuclease subunit